MSVRGLRLVERRRAAEPTQGGQELVHGHHGLVVRLVTVPAVIEEPVRFAFEGQQFRAVAGLQHGGLERLGGFDWDQFILGTEKHDGGRVGGADRAGRRR